jgi:hypothetical protein
VTHYNSLGYLDDIREFCTKQKGFSSLAMYRKVKGLSWVALKLEVLPTSTEATLQYSRN